jgi:hypothetical protein
MCGQRQVLGAPLRKETPPVLQEVVAGRGGAGRVRTTAPGSNRTPAELNLRQLRAPGGHQQAGDGNTTCVRAGTSLRPPYEGAHVQPRIHLRSGQGRGRGGNAAVHSAARRHVGRAHWRCVHAVIREAPQSLPGSTMSKRRGQGVSGGSDARTVPDSTAVTDAGLPLAAAPVQRLPSGSSPTACGSVRSV